MNHKEKKMSLYDYLEPVLEYGTEEQIALARKKYWANYKAAWRKNRRKQQKEFTISFTPKELQIMKAASSKHAGSDTGFIKASALAYWQKQYLATDPIAINRVKELLALNYNVLQQLSEGEGLNNDISTALMKKIADLEQQVLTTLRNPRTLEQWLPEIIADNPENRVKMIELLNAAKNDS
jgi:hypothetical protein